MKRAFSAVKIILLLAGLALIARADLKQSGSVLRIRPSSSELSEVLPEGDLTSFREKPLPHYPGFISEKDSDIRAAALASAEVEPRIKGFADEINTLICVDETGKIRGARIISHRETPYYMKIVMDSGLMEKFSERNIRDGLEDLDAITGATVTSKAIIADVEATAARAAKMLYGLDINYPAGLSITDAFLRPEFIILAIILLLGLSAKYIHFPRRRREAVYVLSIAGIGFYLNTPFALTHLFQFASLKFPGTANVDLAVLGLFVIITTLVAGPLYCGFLCPFGAIQEILYRISPKSWHWNVPAKILSRAREIRYLTLFICVLGFFGAGVSAFSEIEPFSHMFALTKSFAPWLLIVAVLVISLFVRRFWCRFFCPTGACLVMLSSHRKYFKQVEKGLKESEIDPST